VAIARTLVFQISEDDAEFVGRTRDPEQPEFGIQMAWEYQTNLAAGQMAWCVDAAQSNLIFTNRSITENCLPAIYRYQMIDDHTLITTLGEIEERTVLEGDSRRLRELRTGDKLVRRLWENRFSA
jgi:hypothetical protein